MFSSIPERSIDEKRLLSASVKRRRRLA